MPSIKTEKDLDTAIATIDAKQQKQRNPRRELIFRIASSCFIVLVGVTWLFPGLLGQQITGSLVGIYITIGLLFIVPELAYLAYLIRRFTHKQWSVISANELKVFGVRSVAFSVALCLLVVSNTISGIIDGKGAPASGLLVFDVALLVPLVFFFGRIQLMDYRNMKSRQVKPGDAS